jgi:ligand-binding sensor domain-containing protein
LVSASRDGSLRSWRAPGAGELVQSAVSELGADAACALAASGKNVLTGDRRGQLALFEADGSRIVPRARRTDAHCGAVLCIRAFGGDFFSSGADGRVCRWQTDLHATQRLQLESGLWIWALSPGPEGVWLGDAGGRVSLTDLACASAPTRVQRFDAAVRALLPTARGGVWVALASGVLAQLSPRGELTWQARVSSGALLALSEDRLGNLWFGGESGQLSYLTPERTLQQVGAHRDFITSLLPLDDGRMVSSSYDAQVRIWPSAT